MTKSYKKSSKYSFSHYCGELAEEVERIALALPGVYDPISSEFYALFPEFQNLAERARELEVALRRELEVELRDEVDYIDNFITQYEENKK